MIPAMLSWQEILMIVLVVLLLFGSAKIPQLMRGLGSGMSEFKKGLREGEKPDNPPPPPGSGPPPPPA